MVVLLGCAVTPQQTGNMSDLLAQIKTLFGRVFFLHGITVCENFLDTGFKFAKLPSTQAKKSVCGERQPQEKR